MLKTVKNIRKLYNAKLLFVSSDEKINEVIRRFNADEEDFKEFENSDSIKKVVSNYIYYKFDNKTFWGSQEILKYIESKSKRYDNKSNKI